EEKRNSADPETARRRERNHRRQQAAATARRHSVPAAERLTGKIMLNIAGPEYDFGSVVYAVLQDCEHRRRAFDDDKFERWVKGSCMQKIAQIEKMYEEH